ncbi:unnamed protein product [Pneumocystis jirovecii]|nr:unnamed protein product [Pneumocystis jirovecii]
MSYKKVLFYTPCITKTKHISLLHSYNRTTFTQTCIRSLLQIKNLSFQNLNSKTFTTVEKKDTFKEQENFKKKNSIHEYQKSNKIYENLKTNQYFSGHQELKETLKEILREFKAPIQFSFAYGSGVFKQKGNNKEPMIDFIFGVSQAQQWHSLNLFHNNNHYSFLKYFGSYFISYLQEKIKANVYYNPYIKINNITIKYGVITIDDLCQELSEWNTLYLSGRMHKPIKILKDEPRVKFAYNKNLISALRVAMLLLPEKFSEYELYSTISKISYTGDPRMKFAENPNKIEAIVNTQIYDFHQLYFPLINKLPNIQVISNKQTIETCKTLIQDFNPVSRANMIRQLPKKFKDRLYYAYSQKAKYEKINYNEPYENDYSFEKMIIKDKCFHKELIKTIKTTVYWPSVSQTLKGILSGGIYKSWNYLTEKINKNINA